MIIKLLFFIKYFIKNNKSKQGYKNTNFIN